MWPWLAVLILLYLAICAVAWSLEKKLVYFPGPAPSTTPRELGFEQQDVRVRTQDGLQLSAWFLPARAPRFAILVCHGNAGSIQDRIPKAEALLTYGASVLLFDYRGYGASEGDPDEPGTYRDAEAAYDALSALVPTLPIVVYGESLGGAVAIELARHRGVAALLLESTFTSLPDVGACAYPWLPVRWLASLRYDSLAKLPALECPILIAHSRDDEVVPYTQGEALYAAAREPKVFVETHGDHNAGGLLLDPAHEGVLADFLASAARAVR
ncbi:MAG: alpha/beta hydrolase [Planctomycetes bacterium]|nr:alpha/beta hydrolase [Planctomycetota bacterium]